MPITMLYYKVPFKNTKILKYYSSGDIQFFSKDNPHTDSKSRL